MSYLNRCEQHAIHLAIYWLSAQLWHFVIQKIKEASNIIFLKWRLSLFVNIKALLNCTWAVKPWEAFQSEWRDVERASERASKEEDGKGKNEAGQEKKRERFFSSFSNISKDGVVFIQTFYTVAWSSIAKGIKGISVYEKALLRRGKKITRWLHRQNSFKAKVEGLPAWLLDGM